MLFAPNQATSKLFVPVKGVGLLLVHSTAHIIIKAKHVVTLQHTIPNKWKIFESLSEWS